MQCPREKISKTGRLVISEQGIPGIAVDVGGVLGMADHTDVLGVIMFIEEGHNGMERDAGGLGQGKTPVEMEGKSMDATPYCSARRRQER